MLSQTYSAPVVSAFEVRRLFRHAVARSRALTLGVGAAGFPIRGDKGTVTHEFLSTEGSKPSGCAGTTSKDAWRMFGGLTLERREMVDCRRTDGLGSTVLRDVAVVHTRCISVAEAAIRMDPSTRMAQRMMSFWYDGFFEPGSGGGTGAVGVAGKDFGGIGALPSTSGSNEICWAL